MPLLRSATVRRKARFLMRRGIVSLRVAGWPRSGAVDCYHNLYVRMSVSRFTVTFRARRLKRIRQVFNSSRIRPRPRKRERLTTLRT